MCITFPIFLGTLKSDIVATNNKQRRTGNYYCRF